MKHVPQDRFLTETLSYVTIVTRDRAKVFGNPKAAMVIIESLAFFVQNNEVTLTGYVVMPDHVHLLLKPRTPLTLVRWASRFKSYTTHQIAGRGFWQKGYWSESVQSERFCREKLNYVHENPLRAGLTDDLVSYPWSSARQYYEDTFTVVTPYWLMQ